MMAKVTVQNLAGEPVRELELAPEVFDTAANAYLLHQVVVERLARRRQGTHATKTRGEVVGTTRKPYRQKGTGMARAGSFYAPGRRGGGIVFGPKPRTYGGRIPHRLRLGALVSALSARRQAGAIVVVDRLALDAISTRRLQEALGALGVRGVRALLVPGEPDAALVRSAANLPDVQVRPAVELSEYDVLACDRLVLDEAAVQVLEARCR